MGNSIQPGNSALFLLVVKATQDKLADELKGTKAKVLQTSLSNEQEAKLRDLFAADEVEAERTVKSLSQARKEALVEREPGMLALVEKRR